MSPIERRNVYAGIVDSTAATSEGLPKETALCEDANAARLANSISTKNFVPCIRLREPFIRIARHFVKSNGVRPARMRPVVIR